MADTALVTFAVVFHDEEAALPKLLDSVSAVFKENHDKLFHFLFIDNNSTDRSVQTLQQWIHQNPQLRTEVHRRDLNHLAEARSQALSMCQTPWLAFVDADSQLQENWADHVVFTIKEVTEDVVAIGGRSDYWGDQSWHRYALSLAQYFPIGKTQAQVVAVDHIPTNNYLLRVKAGLQAGAFDSIFRFVGEDLDFNCRLRKIGTLLYQPLFGVSHELPLLIEAWYRKMSEYGRAQTMVLLKNKGGVPVEKFFPLLFCIFLNMSLLSFPTITFIVSTLALLIPRTRFFFLTFLFYGLGEFVGFFKYIYLKMNHADSLRQTSRSQ